ncbi:hypothetical protein Nocox_28160 [Nonomuraea coxensis DSM 45129]|uniref:Uncharacterized protein n=1 Tax=Nonomuraea coxensis DSM 45129 TaxID=1122611 RepID=A0ABX8U678_9ACTN|nr:hypothetical protein [Nonomuraea coxensis]QYC43221.1 hypothetical protein Nocox_28160 [Nonomuraea coxensis DSM 45129]
MLDSLIVPLFVTTDLPPDADLAGFGELLAETVRELGGGYPGSLAGRVFWLDRPVPAGQRPAAEGELRFAGMLGHLTATGPGHTVRAVVGDVRRAVGAAVAERYGDVGVTPAVFAIRDQDVRDRTPDTALPLPIRHTTAVLSHL